jgi:hypothetical protein
VDTGLRARTIELLQKLLDRDMSSEEVNQFIGAIPGKIDSETRFAIEAAFHFATDGDIRAREPQYDMQLREDLRRRLSRLQQIE